MNNRHPRGTNQGRSYDPETGEILGQDGQAVPLEDAADDPADDDVTAQQLFGDEGNGPQPDGTIVLPKLTMATIRGNPERAKMLNRPLKIALVTGMAGGELLMPKMDDETKLNAMPLNAIERMTFTALVATMEPWGCVRYDDEGEPDAVYKSDFLFLPVGHRATLERLRRYGTIPVALEFWAQPASNPRGYSWYYHNLAKYDRGISPIDRLMKLGVQAGRNLQLDHKNVGLLADLRAR